MRRVSSPYQAKVGGHQPTERANPFLKGRRMNRFDACCAPLLQAEMCW